MIQPLVILVGERKDEKEWTSFTGPKKVDESSRVELYLKIQEKNFRKNKLFGDAMEKICFILFFSSSCLKQKNYTDQSDVVPSSDTPLFKRLKIFSTNPLLQRNKRPPLVTIDKRHERS